MPNFKIPPFKIPRAEIKNLDNPLIDRPARLMPRGTKVQQSSLKISI
jgi:hypothetical protein